MAEEETKATTEPEKATQTALSPVGKTDNSNDGGSLTRKRTRDDFEEDDKEGAEEEVRKIAPLKRRKSVSEDSKDGKLVRDLQKAEPIEEAKEDSPETKEEDKPEEKKAEENEKKAQEEKKHVTSTNEEKAEDSTKATEPATTESKDGSKEEPKKEETKPKFVFGAAFGSGTPFGGKAFSLNDKKKNVFDSLPSSTPASANVFGSAPGTSTSGSTFGSSTATPSIFGSNSKFGNAFENAIKKQSIFDQAPEKKDEDDTKESEKTEAESAHLYKQVDLEKKEIKSGEENEEQVFTCRAKLYALDLTNVKDGWRERGVGNVHVNKNKEAGKSSRIIMRSIGLLNVILNTALVQGLEVVKGMPSSMNPEKFIRITSLENNKPVQYAIKTGNVDTTDALYEAITDLIPKDV